MLNRVLIAIAVFTAVAAYQFGYYQGRLSVGADEPTRKGLAKAVPVKTARTPQGLPPVTPVSRQQVMQPSGVQAPSSQPQKARSGE